MLKALFTAITFEIPAKQVPKNITKPKSVSTNPKTKKPVDNAHNSKPVDISCFTPMQMNEFFVTIEQNNAER